MLSIGNHLIYSDIMPSFQYLRGNMSQQISGVHTVQNDSHLLCSSSPSTDASRGWAALHLPAIEQLLLNLPDEVPGVFL